MMDQESIEVAIWQALEDLENMGKLAISGGDVQEYLRSCGIEVEMSDIVAVMDEAGIPVE